MRTHPLRVSNKSPPHVSNFEAGAGCYLAGNGKKSIEKESFYCLYGRGGGKGVPQLGKGRAAPRKGEGRNEERGGVQREEGRNGEEECHNGEEEGRHGKGRAATRKGRAATG